MSAQAESLDVKLMIDANQRYTPITSTTILVENTAETIHYRKEAVRSKATDSLTFTVEPSDQFVGRDMYITWDKIPLTVKRHTPTASGFTATTFHETFFDNYENLTMKQYGLLNAINSISITIDGKTISTLNAAEIMEQLGNFYDPEELQRHIDCSNRNIYYSNLVPETNPWIPTHATDGTQTVIKGSSLSESDPFSAAVSDKYNSRTPFFTLTSAPADAATDTAVVTLHGVSTWLPFNVFGINGDNSPIYHASNIQVLVQLQPNWPNRIFQTKRIAGTTYSPYTFLLDRTQWNSNAVGDINLNFKLYRPPQYIRSALSPAKDKYIQSYSLIDQLTAATDVTFSATESTKSFNSPSFSLRSVPKALIIGLVNKRVTDDDYLTDATHFCRIDSLDVELQNTNTNLASGKSSEQLYYISKANGLEMNKQQALYTLGFPVYLETSSNLSCPTNTYVGLSTTDASAGCNLRISCVATRLHYDTEAADFKLSSEKDADKKLFKRSEKTYELRVIVVYAAYFTYNLMGSKFNIIESLRRSELESLSLHVDTLYQSFAPKMNVLGGSWISSLVPTLTRAAKGAFNVIKAAALNKDGLRDSLVKAYKGGASGAGFDNHAPILGGAGYNRIQSNISGGRQVSGWESM